MRFGKTLKIPEDLDFICLWCGKPQEKRSAQQRFCSRECWKAYQYQHTEGPVRYQKSQHSNHEAAPALREACSKLEAQLTPQNRSHWPQVIAQFHAKPVRGYRDLARTARDCVIAKLHLTESPR